MRVVGLYALATTAAVVLLGALFALHYDLPVERRAISTAGVVAISETLSYELSPWNIAVSAVCPGFFRTNLASSLAGSGNRF